MAYIDDHLDPREQALIQTFVDHWQIALDWDTIHAHRLSTPSLRLQSLSHAITSYLAMSPPADQVRQLGDLVGLVIRVDGRVTAEEEITLAEATHQLNAYGRGGKVNYCYVNSVPRSSEQATALVSLLMNVEERQVAGGSTYLVGPYFSVMYAEEVAKQCRALGFLRSWWIKGAWIGWSGVTRSCLSGGMRAVVLVLLWS
ncbi:MAG: hypothetical protein WCO50_05620 [Synechococcus sp. ELA619]